MIIFSLSLKAIPLIFVNALLLERASSNSTIVTSPSPKIATSAFVFLRKYSGSGEGQWPPMI